MPRRCHVWVFVYYLYISCASLWGWLVWYVLGQLQLPASEVGFVEKVSKEEEVGGVHGESQVEMMVGHVTLQALSFGNVGVTIHNHAHHHLRQLEDRDGHGNRSPTNLKTHRMNSINLVLKLVILLIEINSN